MSLPDGPLWLGPLYDQQFVDRLVGTLGRLETGIESCPLKVTTFKKIKGLLNSIQIESPLFKNPYAYNYEKIFIIKGCNQPTKRNVL